MRRGLARTGGTLAIGLSALWALPAAGFIVFGVLLFLSGNDSDVSVGDEGFAEFFGGSLAVVGLFVLAGAVGGIVLGIRIRRGRNGARVGLGLLFTLFALVSGSFLASAIADDFGVDPSSVAVLGLNTAVCVFVVVSALFGRPD
jgi:ABC-type Fe3+ transport system permease subunit